MSNGTRLLTSVVTSKGPLNHRTQALLSAVLIAVIATVIVLSLFLLGILKLPSSPPPPIPPSGGFTGLNVTSGSSNSTVFKFNIENTKNVTATITSLIVGINGVNYSGASCAAMTLSPRQTTVCSLSNSFSGTFTARIWITYTAGTSNVTQMSNGYLTLTVSSSAAVTAFTETGLPSSTGWTVNYDGSNNVSLAPTITFTLTSGTYNYAISNVSVPVNSSCSMVYVPSPATGSLNSGASQVITFSAVLNCHAGITTFTETGLPSGTSWIVLYTMTNTSNTPGITFTLPPGTYPYIVSSVQVAVNSSCTKTYSPSPSSGNLSSGSTQAITFSPSAMCSNTVTTFTETGLPSGYRWNVTYSGTNSSSTNKITFTTSPGSYTFSIPKQKNTTANCYSTYTPSPASGTLSAGSSQTVSFSSSNACYSNITETGLPSGPVVASLRWNFTWTTVNGSNHTADAPGNGQGPCPYGGGTCYKYKDWIYWATYTNVTHPFYVHTLVNKSGNCNTTYIPTPASGRFNAGSAVPISFSSGTTCLSKFIETGLPSGTFWQVNYKGWPFPIGSFTTVDKFVGVPGNYTFSVSTIPNSSNGCTTNYTASPSSGWLVAGGTKNIGFTMTTFCTTTFTESGLPSGMLWGAAYDNIMNFSTSSSISFNVPKGGSYIYNVSYGATSACSDFIPSSVSGSAAAGSTVAETYSPGCLIYAASNKNQTAAYVINNNTHTLLSSIPMHTQYTTNYTDVAVSPDGKHLYALGLIGTTYYLSGFGALNGTHLFDIPVGQTFASRAITFSITPDSRYAVLSTFFSGTGEFPILIIDLHAKSVLAFLATNGGNPKGVAITPNGTFAYFTKNAYAGGPSGAILKLNIPAQTIVSSYSPGSIGAHPNGITASPDGQYIYVATDSAISKISTVTGGVVWNYTPTSYSTANFMSLSPGGGTLFETSPASGQACNISTVNPSAGGKCNGGLGIVEGILPVSSASNYLIASNNLNEVFDYKGSSFSVIYGVSEPYGMALGPNRGLYYANTTFSESGLYPGLSWAVDYAGMNVSSTGTSITFNNLAPANTYSFTVYRSCRVFVISGHIYYTLYTPLPSSGNLVVGTPESISFSSSEVSYC